MKKQKLYILLSDSNSIISKGIKIYTRKPYSHVSIALDKDLNEIYSFSRLKPYNPLIGGFIREDIDVGTFSVFPNTIVELYSIDITLDQYKQIQEEIKRFSESERRYTYNYLGIIGIIINRPINREYKYFCSQFVAEVLTNSDIKIIEKDKGLTAPNDFRNHKDLNLVYRGNLQEYTRNTI